MWVDLNGNARADRGEVANLGRIKMESIDLGYIEMMEVDEFGNQSRQRSTFRRVVKGKSQPFLVVDAWFNTLVSY